MIRRPVRCCNRVESGAHTCRTVPWRRRKTFWRSMNANASSFPHIDDAGGPMMSRADSVSEAETLLFATAHGFAPLSTQSDFFILGLAIGTLIGGFCMMWIKHLLHEKSLSQKCDEIEGKSPVDDLEAQLFHSSAVVKAQSTEWLNEVVKAAWPYLDAATSAVIVNALDPILQNTRPSFLTSIEFEKFSFGSVPALVEGVKVYESGEEGALEIDLHIFWAGDPDVVLKIRAAQDALAVPVSLTEFECSFTLRLIFAPLIGVFPCFGALTISLTEDPEFTFDLRVVGGDITLLPGLAQPLQTYIQALIASFLVWPRCITVPIPGTGYALPDRERVHAGLLHIELHSHDGLLASPAEVSVQLRWPGEMDPHVSQEVRLQALPGGSFLNGREVTLSVEDTTRQLLSIRWYSSSERNSDSSYGRVLSLVGETRLLLDDITRQIPFARDHGDDKDWGPVTVAAELESILDELSEREVESVAGSTRGRISKLGTSLLSRLSRFSSQPSIFRDEESAKDTIVANFGARIIQLTVRYQSLESIQAPAAGGRTRSN